MAGSRTRVSVRTTIRLVITLPSLHSTLLQHNNLPKVIVCAAGAWVTSVKFDNSGQYLAAGGMDARIYGVKQDWQLLSTLSDIPQKVCLTHSAQVCVYTWCIVLYATAPGNAVRVCCKL